LGLLAGFWLPKQGLLWRDIAVSSGGGSLRSEPAETSADFCEQPLRKARITNTVSQPQIKKNGTVGVPRSSGRNKGTRARAFLLLLMAFGV